MADKQGKGETENLLDLQPAKETSVTSLRPYKFGFLAVFAARGLMVSYFPLYLKQLGLNPMDIGIVMFFRSVGGFVGGAFVPCLKSITSRQKSMLLSFAGILLVSGLAMGFLSAPTLSTRCRVSVNNSHPGISTGDDDSVHSTDFTWMYREDFNYLVVLSSLIMFLSEFSGFGIDTIQHAMTMVALGKGNSHEYGSFRAWGAFGRTITLIPTGFLLWCTQNTVKICGGFFAIVKYNLVSYVFMGISFSLLLNVNNMQEDDNPKLEEDSSHTEEDENYSSQDDSANFKDVDSSDILEGDKSNIQANQVPSNYAKDDCSHLTSSEHDTLLHLLCSIKVLPWLFVLLSRSMFCAVTQGFLNWYMDNLGADPLLIGVSNGVTTTTEFFVFFLTPFLIRKFGHTSLATAGIMSYIIRLLVLSFISQPIWIILLEILEGAMFAILWSSLVSYLSTQVHRDRQSQMQGLILVVKVLGSSVGYLLSGYLTQLLGARAMFQIFAVCASFVSVVFILTQIIQLNWIGNIFGRLYKTFIQRNRTANCID